MTWDGIGYKISVEHKCNELVIFIQVQPDGSNKKETKNVKAAIARLASQENLTSSYDLVLGLVRRPPSPRPCRHAPSPPPSPPPARHHHCPCHAHHHCHSSRDRHPAKERTESRRPPSRSRPSSPSPSSRGRSRSRPASPAQAPAQSKSKWSFVKKAKRSASADRDRHSTKVELGWDDVRPGVTGQWEDTGSHGWAVSSSRPEPEAEDNMAAATTAQLAGELCRRATALRRTLYKLPQLINMRSHFLEIIK